MSVPGSRSRAAELLGQLFAELMRRNHLKDLLERSQEGAGREMIQRLADEIEALIASSVPEPPEPAVPAESDVPRPRVELPPPPPPIPIPPTPPPERERPTVTNRPLVPAARKETEVSPRHHIVAKQAIEIPEEASFYCHGVGGIPPDDKPAVKPFLLEEKGIDGQRLAFAWDYGNLRFYLSMMHEENVAVGRDGTLLLPKQDSIRLRGVHESIMNDLRLHGILLPFPFGTVVHAWSGAQKKLIGNIPRLLPALDKLQKTRKWTLTVSALDSRFAELQQNPTLEKRRELDRHRISYSSAAGTRRIDVRELERVLNKQRRVAEGIHKELSTVADRTEVQTIVSLQSGSSEEWKQILRATYEISPTMITRFHRMVTEVQYEHILLELMIALTGDVEAAPALGEAT
jgi:hypothetical protein